MSGSWRQGLRVGATLAAPTFALAVTFGALARGEGWGVLAPIVASLVVFSGSAQFALLTVLASGGAAWSAVAAAGMMNTRFLPMALAAGPSLRGGRVRKAIEAQAVVDASWAAAHQGDGRFDRDLLIASTVVQWPAWIGGTVLGVLVAPPDDLVDALGLDMLFPAFFVLLLLDEVRESARARVAAALGAAITAGALLVLPAGPALLLGSAAALVGLVPERPARGAA